MIRIGDQVFEAFYCSWCGAKDSSQELMAKHEDYHRRMTEWIKGLTPYSDESPRYLSNNARPKKKCLETHCDRIAVAKGRCQRCHERTKSELRKAKLRQKKAVGLTAATVVTVAGFIQGVMASV